MLGEPDELYVRARAALLDVTDALGPHLDAMTLVGAQAVYLHTQAVDLMVAEYTTDADLAVGPPENLDDAPLIAALMVEGGFEAHEHLGRWVSPNGVFVDLMVPEALAGAGSRGARLGPHGKRVARRARGLEAALVDRDLRTIGALDPDDDRSVTMNVAGPGALLVAKIHKITERVRETDRIRDKDSLDVLRLLRATATEDLGSRLRHLHSNELSASVTSEAVTHIPDLFGHNDAPGVEMAVRAAGLGVDSSVISASIVVLIEELLAEL